jgi:hypothetical protein
MSDIQSEIHEAQESPLDSLIQTFQSQGHFDSLRKSLLESFLSSKQAQGLEQEILSILDSERERVQEFQRLRVIQGQDPLERAKLHTFLLNKITL